MSDKVVILVYINQEEAQKLQLSNDDLEGLMERGLDTYLLLYNQLNDKSTILSPKEFEALYKEATVKANYLYNYHYGLTQTTLFEILATE